MSGSRQLGERLRELSLVLEEELRRVWLIINKVQKICGNYKMCGAFFGSQQRNVEQKKQNSSVINPKVSKIVKQDVAKGKLMRVQDQLKNVQKKNNQAIDTIEAQLKQMKGHPERLRIEGKYLLQQRKMLQQSNTQLLNKKQFLQQRIQKLSEIKAQAELADALDQTTAVLTEMQSKLNKMNISSLLEKAREHQQEIERREEMIGEEAMGEDDEQVQRQYQAMQKELRLKQKSKEEPAVSKKQVLYQ